MSTPGQPDKTESTMTPTPTNADPMDQNKVSSTILDLTSLPGDLSLASIIAHIKSLENQKNEHLMDIESIKTANTALDGKIKRLEEQLPDAEHELRDKITKREKVEAEIGEAEEVIRGLRASANEFKNKLKQNDELEKKRQESVVQAKDLINLLQKIKNTSERAAITREGKFICKYCGMTHMMVAREKHDARCWGRCRHCYVNKLACNCGEGQNFTSCANCNKTGATCAKLGTRRQEAKEASVLKKRKL